MKIITIIVSLILGFSIWYLLGWFVSNEYNMFLWPAYGKLIYIFLSCAAANGIAEVLDDNL